MPVTNVGSKWSSGNLIFHEKIQGNGASIQFGEDDHGLDVYFRGATSGAYAMWDEANDKLVFEAAHFQLNDDAELRFGDLAAGDIVVLFDGSDFKITPATDAEGFLIGADSYTLNVTLKGSLTVGKSGTGHDVILYGDTADAFAKWDQANDKLIMDKADIQLGDSDELRFGDLAAGDVVVTFDGSDFKITPAANGEGMLIGADSYTMNVTLKGSLTVGKDGTGHDVTLYGDTAGAYVQWDQANDRLAFVGGASMIAGSYGSRVDVGSSTGIHFGQFWGDGAGSAVFHIGLQLFMSTTETARPFPLCVQAEMNSTGLGADRMQAAQFIALLGGGGEASQLGALGGDAVAGMYAVWCKVGANVSCSTESGARVAAIWLDNQMNCVINGEEYAAFITCGGSKVDAVFGLETTSSGWTNLFSFDETSYDQDPVVASGCNVSGAGASEAYLRVNLNGTEYGLPLIAI